MKHLSYLKSLLALLLAAFALGAAAQQKPQISIWLRVYDSFSHELVGDAKVTLLYADGAVADTCTTTGPKNTNSNSNGFSMNATFKHHGSPWGNPRYPTGKFVVRVEHPNYETAADSFEVKGRRTDFYTHIPGVAMRRKPAAPHERQLGEAVVKATRVKMVMKGDTIIYNADAFQLAEGSMLDNLIRQLPGMELRAGGQILLNGRQVSSLLVNGEDFFRGDPKVALDNLPAYMVDKVKAYEKAPEWSYLQARRDTLERNPLVVDVQLKRQYSVGWVANAEASYGTHERYLGRLFGLRFTPCSRLALYGNVNNTNDTREPGTSGDWTPQWTAQGLTALKEGGAELLVKDKTERWKLTSNLKVLHEDMDISNATSNERFLEGGNAFGRSDYRQDNCQTHVISSHALTLKNKHVYFSLSPGIDYLRKRSTSRSRAAEFRANPAVDAPLDSLFRPAGSRYLEETLTNRREETSLSNYSWLKTWGSMSFWGDVPNTPDNYSVEASGRYEKYDNDVFSHYDLRYGGTAPDDFRNQFTSAPSVYYNVAATVSYWFDLPQKDLYMTPSYTYRRTYSCADRNLYRLDKYENYDSADGLAIGTLPSTVDSLQQALDRQNSYWSTRTGDVHRLAVRVDKEMGKFRLEFTPAVERRIDRLDYVRGSVDAHPVRRKWAFAPKLRLRWNRLDLNYAFTQSDPDLVSLLDVTDDANPLYVSRGNAGLKRAAHHNATLDYNNSTRGRKHHFLTFNASYNLWRHSVAQSVVYDRATGVTTSRPVNVDGNWAGQATLSYNTPLDRDRRYALDTRTSATYRNSVDLVQTSDQAGESPRSSVRNLRLAENVRFTARWGNWHLSAKADVSWNRAESPRPDFATIRAADVNYGLTAQCPLPWKLQLSTDLTMYTRRGYSDASLNTDDLVWNARLSRTFFGSRLTVMADGFDLLGQLTNIWRTLNAQGRTETRYNVVPSYVLFHVIYRLNREPKKRQ